MLNHEFYKPNHSNLEPLNPQWIFYARVVKSPFIVALLRGSDEMDTSFVRSTYLNVRIMRRRVST